MKEEPKPEPVKGEVTVKYNHYKEKFPIVDGVLLEELINEQYCLSYAFKGDYQMHLREDVKCAFEDRVYIPKHPTIDKAWAGLEDKKIYIVEVEEDAAEEAERRKNAKPIQFYKAEDGPKKNGRIDGITN